MTALHNYAFDSLLTAWNDHQELRKRRATAAELIASRNRLDAARLHASTIMK